MNLAQLLFFGFGFTLSINQGFTIVLGTLSNGVARGADVIMPSDLFMYALFFLKSDWSAKSKYRNTVLYAKILAILFLLWSVSGEFISLEPADFRFGLVHLFRAILVFVFVMTRVTTRKDVIALTTGLMIGLGFQALIGVWQWQIGPVSLPFINITNTWRSTGTVGPANAFGCYIAALAPMAIRVGMFTKMKFKWLWLGIAVLCMGSLFASFTRGAWLSFAVSMAFFVAIDFKKKKLKRQQKMVLIAFSLVGLIFMSVKYGHVIAGRMEGAEEAIVSDKKHSRMGLALNAMEIVNEHQLFGVGLNNYRYHSDEDIQGTRIVHNAYLLIMAQQGIPGFILFIILHLVIFLSGLRILKIRDPILYHIGSACLTGMASMLIYHMIAPDYRLVPVLLQHWRLLGMIPAIMVVDDRTRKMLRQKQYWAMHMRQQKAVQSPGLEPQ